MKILNLILVSLLILIATLNLNAQIPKPVNKQIDLDKVKPNKRPDLKLKESGLRGFVTNSDGKEKIAGVKIIFEHKDGKTKRQTVISGSSGEFKITLRPGQYLTYALKDGYIPYVTHPSYNVVQYGIYGTLNIFMDKEKKIRTSMVKNADDLIAIIDSITEKPIDIVKVSKASKQKLKKGKNTMMFYAKSNGRIDTEKIPKGTMITINLEQPYIPGDQFIPGDEFIPGNQFVLNNTKFIVADKTEKELKIVAY